MWALKLMFAGAMQEIATFGILTLLIAACLAAAWFMPFFKRQFLSAAAALAIGMFAYGAGVQHEYDRNRAREKVIEKQTSLARESAEKYVAANPDPAAGSKRKWLRKPKDPYNRDN